MNNEKACRVQLEKKSDEEVTLRFMIHGVILVLTGKVPLWRKAYEDKSISQIIKNELFSELNDLSDFCAIFDISNKRTANGAKFYKEDPKGNRLWAIWISLRDWEDLCIDMDKILSVV